MVCSPPQTPPPVFSNKESLMNAGNVAVSFSDSKIVAWSLLVKRTTWRSLSGNVALSELRHGLQSVLIFSILNYSWSFIVFFYLSKLNGNLVRGYNNRFFVQLIFCLLFSQVSSLLV